MEPTRRQTNRLAWKLFWAFLIISLFPIVVLLTLAFVLSGEQLRTLPASLQQRLLIALIALTLTTVGLIWMITGRLGRRMSALARSVRLAAQGRPAEPAAAAGNDEISETAQWFNRLADQMAHNQNLLMSQDSEENTTRRQAAALVAQQALMAGSLDDLMRSSIDMFLRHFGCSFGALYLLESKELASKIHITLAYSAGILVEEAQSFTKRYAEKRINLDQVPTMEWMVGRAIASRRPQVGPAAAHSIVYEAALPLIQPSSDGPRVIGALDLLSTSRVSDARVGPFSVRTVAEMQGIANVLALAIGGFTTVTSVRDGAIPTQPGATTGTRYGARVDPDAIFSAIGLVAQAQTVDQALDALRGALRNAPYASAILIRPGDLWEPESTALTELVPEITTRPSYLQVVVGRALRTQPPGMNEPPLVLPSPRLTSVESFFLSRIENETRNESGDARAHPLPLTLYDLDIRSNAAASNNHEDGEVGEDAAFGDVPVELISIARRMGCRSAAFLPAVRNERLAALLMIGAGPEMSGQLLRAEALEPFQNLVRLAAAALERIHTASFTRRKLAEMETLWQFTQAVSMETDLNVLFRRLQKQVENVMGPIDSFAVGFYESSTNSVGIPYLLEHGQQINIPTFPLGTGFSSVVIRTRKPLLLSTAKEIQDQSIAMSSILAGEEPRSWLGVPMIHAGEVVGLIIVQDTVQEGRFSAADAQLLLTLAAQVAVVVRNVRLLEASRRQARQERILNEISDRIRRSVDIQSILKTTADELASALGARRAVIRIGLDEAKKSYPSNVFAAAAETEAAFVKIQDGGSIEGSAPRFSGSPDHWGAPYSKNDLEKDGSRYDALPTPVAAPDGLPAMTIDEPIDHSAEAAIHRDITRQDVAPKGDSAPEQVSEIEIPLVLEPIQSNQPERSEPETPAAAPQAPSASTSEVKPSEAPAPFTRRARQESPSRPQADQTPAFTLGQQIRPETDKINPPSAPRPKITPFIDAEELDADAPDKRAETDHKERFQSADTQPLQTPDEKKPQGAGNQEGGAV